MLALFAGVQAAAGLLELRTFRSARLRVKGRQLEEWLHFTHARTRKAQEVDSSTSIGTMSSDSDDSEENETWIQWFCRLKGNEFFCEVRCSPPTLTPPPCRLNTHPCPPCATLRSSRAHPAARKPLMR